MIAVVITTLIKNVSRKLLWWLYYGYGV